jgi:Mg2+ and Co2+ transporter CorA
MPPLYTFHKAKPKYNDLIKNNLITAYNTKKKSRHIAYSLIQLITN